MHKSGKPIGFWSAIALGMGAMIGAGIFALLGEAGAIASASVYISFLLGGIIALLSGYSMAKLGARFPAAGGVVEYIVQGFGVNVFSGTASILFYIVGLMGMALVAKAFGSYGATFFPNMASGQVENMLAVSILVFLGAINYRGAGNVAKLENIIVVLKVSVLLLLGLTGLYYLQPELLSPKTYPPFSNTLSAISITFFAYTGFGVITNTAEDMPNPQKTLPKAMLTAIVLVMLIYVLVAVSVFGNLPASEVMAAKEYALAEAAKPVFGNTGFRIVAIAALISTASAINASLYSVTNVTYQLAKDGELPAEFGKPIGHSREGMVISLLITVVLVLFFDLGQIAAAGSLSVLLVHAAMHLGHLRLLKKTGASVILVVAALLATIAAVVMGGIYASRHAEGIVWMIVGFVLAAFLIEILLRLVTGRRLQGRTEQE